MHKGLILHKIRKKCDFLLISRFPTSKVAKNDKVYNSLRAGVLKISFPVQIADFMENIDSLLIFTKIRKLAHFLILRGPAEKYDWGGGYSAI